jgi:uncharacterized protein (DUF433 family)
MASALSGATVSQLHHWRSRRTGPLLAPEFALTLPSFYSFRDVVALRTCVRLRASASLPRIRAAIDSLPDLDEVEHLASYQLVSDVAGNIQLASRDEAADLLRSPGHRRIFADMGEVIEAFPARTGVVVPHLLRPRAHLTADPGIQGGVPVITGTRVPYDVVASLMSDVAAEQIAEYYPGVSAEAARDALSFARYLDSYNPATQAA